MDVTNNYNFIKTTKFILVVFCFLFVYGCKSDSKSKVEVNYDLGKAINVSYPSEMILGKVKIFLKSNSETPVLGDLKKIGNRTVFEPIIPFNSGSTYVIFQNQKPVIEFNIKEKINVKSPELIAIFPSSDTVPENLLKMYFQFSKPMQEVGNALDYITITDNTTGKEVDVFLELNSELWNKEHTLLTLWLDPGRIKTDLIPNKTLGLPILKNHNYTLTIDKNWKDADGIVLKQMYTKTFTVTNRDSENPKVASWKLEVSPKTLTIYFNESLDEILTKEVFSIKNKNDVYVSGHFEILEDASVLKFYPKKPFENGKYNIIVESKLEDLAGNNLNHPFDTNLIETNSEVKTEFKTRSFRVD